MPKTLTPHEIAQVRTLVGPLTAGMVVRMCDSHEHLRLERELLTTENERLHSELDACNRALVRQERALTAVCQDPHTSRFRQAPDEA